MSYNLEAFKKYIYPRATLKCLVPYRMLHDESSPRVLAGVPLSLAQLHIDLSSNSPLTEVISELRGIPLIELVSSHGSKGSAEACSATCQRQAVACQDAY